MQNFLLIVLFFPTFGWASLKAGVGVQDITPAFEGRRLEPRDRHYLFLDPWEDTGIDLLYDFEEPGAWGLDGAPGIAGVDDDGNGLIDDCDRNHCKEYFAKNSDDLADPNGDNFHLLKNPRGTEGDHRFQSMSLGGYAPLYPFFMPRRFASAVHDPIWSRAVAIQDAQERTVILISTDLPGLGWKYINPVKRRIEKELGIPFENIIIASTHDHAAPDAAGYWISVSPGRNDAWMKQVKEKMFLSAREAVASLENAEMIATTTDHIICQDAQTQALKRMPDCHFAAARPLEGPQHDKWIIQRDKRDPHVPNSTITLAHFRRPGGGATLATLVSWHNHPEDMGDKNSQISSDYAHYLRQFVEAKLGGTAVYFTGTLGNQIGAATALLWDEEMNRVYSGQHDSLGNPLPVLVDDRSWDKIRSVGYEIGNEVVQAVQNFSEDPVSHLNLDIRVGTVDLVVNSALHTLASKTAFWHDVEKPDRTFRNFDDCLSVVGCARHHISLITFNDVISFASLPGEIDPSYYFGRPEPIEVDYGKKHKKHTFPAMPGLKDHLPGRHHFMIGQGNGYLSYLVHSGDNHGWANFSHPNVYEETVTISRSFGDQAANKLMELAGSSTRYDSFPAEAEDLSQLWSGSTLDLLKRVDKCGDLGRDRHQ